MRAAAAILLALALAAPTAAQEISYLVPPSATGPAATDARHVAAPGDSLDRGLVRAEAGAPSAGPVAEPTPAAKARNRDLDLAPWYGGVAVSRYLDLRSTSRGLATKKFREANPTLVVAEDFAERVGLSRSAGRNILSVGLGAAFCVIVRNYVYPSRPRLAKVLLAGFAIGGAALALNNERQIRLAEAPPTARRTVAVTVRF